MEAFKNYQETKAHFILGKTAIVVLIFIISSIKNFMVNLITDSKGRSIAQLKVNIIMKIKN